jgi:predicted outer membrane repeat protein
MFGKSWLNKFLSPLGAFGQRRPRSRKAKAREPRRQRLWIELLEARDLPSAIIVTNSMDEVDGNTSSIAALMSNPGADGTISLREAILASNNTPGANSITFAPGTSGMPIRLSQGQLSISNAVTITGLGAANTTVSGEFRSLIFDISAAGAVTLDGLTLTDGKGFDTGAIRSQFAFLTVSNSTISDNLADGATFAAGGGINSFGAVTVSNSTISRNSSGGGGGIFAQGAVTVSNSTISGNSSLQNARSRGYGGGVFSFSGAAMTISNSTISGNSADGGGGGIEARGNVTISNSTVSHNIANSYSGGGGIHAGRGVNVTISSSTISDNFAGFGGGVFADGTVTVINSTISGNSANFGGGIYSNRAVTVRSSIVAGNSDNYGSPDLVVNSSLTVSNSLVGNNSGTRLTPAPVGAPDANGNFIGTPAAPIDPLLGPLADNGGPTQTMALRPGSPAIDRGANPDNLTTDQRGPPYTRTAGIQTDMGAYEVNAVTAASLEQVLTTTSSVTLPAATSADADNIISAVNGLLLTPATR